ncbi:MFS monocarboxylate transporter [Thozetella sp. PMI_491]|nr:MFS monocarboxylate transporter [Thozetella sp. PMI_491]
MSQPKYDSISNPNEDAARDHVTEPEDLEYPDGGSKAWLVTFGCFCAFFAGLSLMNSVGVYQSWLSQNQLKDESPARIGWMFGCYNFFSFFLGVPLGPVFDAKGPRIMTACGAVLLLATYLLLSACDAYWHFFLCLGLLGSLSTCLLFTAAIGTIQHWFLKRRGLATGLAISGGSVGGIIFPLVLGPMFSKIGFAWSMRASALIMLPFVAVALTFVEGRASVRQKLSEDMPYKRFLPNPKILLDPRLAVLTVGAFFIEIGLFIPMTYVVSFSLDSGLTRETAFRMATLMNVGSLLGRWLPGYTGDRFGRFNAQIGALALCLVTVMGIWRPAGQNPAALTAFVILFGLGSGSGISLVPVCIAQLCETQNYGKTFTAVYSLASIGSLIGVPMGGQILQASQGDYANLILLAGLSYTVALCCFVSVRVMSVGFRLTKRF